MEKKNKPVIRFKGFEEDWCDLQVSDLGEIVTGSTPTTSDKSNYNGTRLFVSPADIQNERYVSKTLTTLSEKGFKSGRILKSGSTLFVSIGSTIGKVGQVKTEVTSNQQINAIVPFDSINSDFVFSLMESISTRIRKLAATQAVPIINKTSFSLVDICIPQKTEQQKIGNFFENIDKLITQHQQKHSKLQALKKAMLGKMFPKQGQTVPEIRFKGFEGDWVEKNVGIICSTTIGVFVIKTKQNDLSPYPVYNGGISYTGFYDEYNNEPNKIVISARGANAGFVNIVKTKYWAGNSCYSVDVLDKESFDIDFLFYYIKENQSRFLENQQAANIPSVSKSDVERFLIFHPTKSEQTVIAKYLLSLDNLISNHQTQMTKLQNIKKALLAKMFV